MVCSATYFENKNPYAVYQTIFRSIIYLVPQSRAFVYIFGLFSLLHNVKGGIEDNASANANSGTPTVVQ